MSSEKLGRKKMIGFTLGVVPTILYNLVFGMKYVELFYDKLQLLPVYFILGQIIYMTVNALNDPLSGQLSDRTDPKKWGSRRLIYIKWGGPIWALTFLLIWFPWSFTNQLIIFLHYVISICLFDTMLTLVVLVWMALLPEMTTDHDERNKATFYTMVVGLIAALPFLLILGDMDPTIDLFRTINIVIAIISTICLFAVTKLCEERPELHTGVSYPLIESVKESLKSRSFLVYVCFNFFGVLAGSFGLTYLFVYLLVLGDGGLLIYIVLGIIVGYASNIWALRLHEKNKWDMRTIVLRFGGIRILFTAIFLPFVLFTSDLFFIWVLLALGALFSGYGVFNTPLMYLSMDEDEVKNNTRREGMFLGMNALITKPANSIGPIIATFVLGYFGYITGTDIQPESALFGIKLLLFALPALFVALSILFMIIYPLHGEELQELKKKLEQAHTERLANSSRFSASGSLGEDGSTS
ncbi:MAG: MFS transporter [Candidatus Thorarchaeota archaeon]